MLIKISHNPLQLLQDLLYRMHANRTMVNVRVGDCFGESMSMAIRRMACGSSRSSRSIKGLPITIDALRSYVTMEPSSPPAKNHRPPGTRYVAPVCHWVTQRFRLYFTSSHLQPTSALLLINTHRSNSCAEYDSRGSSKRADRIRCATY